MNKLVWCPICEEIKPHIHEHKELAYNQRVCKICGKVCWGHRCMSCFKKNVRKNLSRIKKRSVSL